MYDVLRVCAHILYACAVCIPCIHGLYGCVCCFFFLHSPVRKLMCNYSAERCTQFMRTRAQERGSGKGCELLPLSVSASTQTAGSLIEPLRICILYLHELVRIKQREYGGVQQQYPRKREKKTN